MEYNIKITDINHIKMIFKHKKIRRFVKYDLEHYTDEDFKNVDDMIKYFEKEFIKSRKNIMFILFKNKDMICIGKNNNIKNLNSSDIITSIRINKLKRITK